MSAMLWRTLIAVIAMVILNLLLPPVLRLLGIEASGDLLLVVRIVAAALAVLYIIRGGPPYPV